MQNPYQNAIAQLDKDSGKDVELTHKMRKLLLSFLLISALSAGIFSFPFTVSADFFSAPSFSSLVPCGNSSGTAEEMAPCTSCHIAVLFQRLIEYGVYLSTFLMILGLIIAGGMFIVSGVNNSETLRTRGKSLIKVSVTGFLLVLGSYFLVNLIFWTLGREENAFENTWGNYSCNVTSSSPQ